MPDYAIGKRWLERLEYMYELGHPLSRLMGAFCLVIAGLNGFLYLAGGGFALILLGIWMHYVQDKFILYLLTNFYLNDKISMKYYTKRRNRILHPNWPQDAETNE